MLNHVNVDSNLVMLALQSGGLCNLVKKGGEAVNHSVVLLIDEGRR